MDFIAHSPPPVSSDILQLPSRALDEQQLARQKLHDKESRQQHQHMEIEQVGEEREKRGGLGQKRQELGTEVAMHSAEFKELKRTVEAKDAMLEGGRHVESSVASCALDVTIEAFAQELRAAQLFIAASERDEQGASAHRRDLLNDKHVRGAKIVVRMHVHLAMSKLQQQVSSMLEEVEDLAGQAGDHTHLNEYLARKLAASEQERHEMSGVIASLLHNLACARTIVEQLSGILQECRCDLDAHTRMYAREARLQGAARYQHVKVLERLEQVRQAAFSTVSEVIAESPLVEAVVNSSLEDQLLSPVRASAEEMLAYDTNSVVQVLARSVSTLALRQQHQQMCEEDFDRALRCAYEWMSLEEHHAQYLQIQLRMAEAQHSTLQTTLMTTQASLSQMMRRARTSSATLNKCVALLAMRRAVVCACRTLRFWHQYATWCETQRFAIRKVREKFLVRLLRGWQSESKRRQQQLCCTTRKMAVNKRSLLSASFQRWSIKSARNHQISKHIAKCRSARARHIMSALIKAWNSSLFNQHQSLAGGDVRTLATCLQGWSKFATQAGALKKALTLAMHRWRVKTLLVHYAFSSWRSWLRRQQKCCAVLGHHFARELHRVLVRWRQRHNMSIRLRILLRNISHHVAQRALSLFVRQVLTKLRLRSLTMRCRRFMILTHMRKWQRIARILAFVTNSCAQEASKRDYHRVQTFFARWQAVRSRKVLVKDLHCTVAANMKRWLVRRVVWEWMFVHIQRLKVRVNVAYRQQRRKEALESMRACIFLRWRVLVAKQPWRHMRTVSTTLMRFLMRWLAFTSAAMDLRSKIMAWKSKGRARDFSKRLIRRAKARTLSTWVLWVAWSFLQERARSKRTVGSGGDKREAKAVESRGGSASSLSMGISNVGSSCSSCCGSSTGEGQAYSGSAELCLPPPPTEDSSSKLQSLSMVSHPSRYVGLNRNRLSRGGGQRGGNGDEEAAGERRAGNISSLSSISSRLSVRDRGAESFEDKEGRFECEHTPSFSLLFTGAEGLTGREGDEGQAWSLGAWEQDTMLYPASGLMNGLDGAIDHHRGGREQRPAGAGGAGEPGEPGRGGAGASFTQSKGSERGGGMTAGESFLHSITHLYYAEQNGGLVIGKEQGSREHTIWTTDVAGWAGRDDAGAEEAGAGLVEVGVGSWGETHYGGTKRNGEWPYREHRQQESGENSACVGTDAAVELDTQGEGCAM